MEQNDTPTPARRAAVRPAQPGGQRSKRIGQIVVVVLAIVVVVDAVVGDRGFLAMRRAQLKYDTLSQALDRQRAENSRLQEEARRLRDDPSTIEELARRDLGLMRPGETIFIVKDVKIPTAP